LPSTCDDQKVAPVSVILACADAGLFAKQLVWRDWGAEQAHATGVLSVNTCDPSCAEGNREEYPVQLTANRLLDCDYGKPQYTHVTYTLPADSPFEPGTVDQSAKFPCPTRPHANPKIKRMRMQLTGHHPRPNRYFVQVHIRLRICAVRGRSEVVFNETKRIGGKTFGEHTRTLRYRQRSRCQSRPFRWHLRDEFFSVGTYKVAATVWDKDYQFSKTVSRRQITLD
jgi:hypothetical protein